MGEALCILMVLQEPRNVQPGIRSIAPFKAIFPFLFILLLENEFVTTSRQQRLLD